MSKPNFNYILLPLYSVHHQCQALALQILLPTSSKAIANTIQQIQSEQDGKRQDERG
jgi:hypothetical protein